MSLVPAMGSVILATKLPDDSVTRLKDSRRVGNTLSETIQSLDDASAADAEAFFDSVDADKSGSITRDGALSLRKRYAASASSPFNSHSRPLQSLFLDVPPAARRCRLRLVH